MIGVTLAICASIAAGTFAGRRWDDRAQHVARRTLDAVLWLVLPPCVFINIAHFRFDAAEVTGIADGYLVAVAAGGAAWIAGRRLFSLTRPTAGALICCAVVGNTGYFGLPVTLALLGRSHLGAATTWDAMISGPAAFVGAFGLVPAASGRARLRAFFLRNPVLWAIAAGLAVPRGWIPHVLIAPAQLTLTALLPVGFAVLGVHLAGHAERAWWHRPDRPMLVAIALRMGVAPAVFVLLASLTHGVPTAFYLQAAAPTGLNALITSHVHGLDSGFTATVVAWSTVLGLAAILALLATGLV